MQQTCVCDHRLKCQHQADAEAKENNINYHLTANLCSDQNRVSDPRSLRSLCRNQWTNPGQWSNGSFYAPWYEWSWIIDPSLDHFQKKNKYTFNQIWQNTDNSLNEHWSEKFLLHFCFHFSISFFACQIEKSFYYFYPVDRMSAVNT